VTQIPKGDVKFFYDKIYSEIIGRKSGWILSRLAAYPHKILERNFKSNEKLEILEIGAGSGEHLDFVTNNFAKYVALDIDEVRLSQIDLVGRKKITPFKGNAEELQFPSNSFDRVIATCVLAHLKNPEIALVEWRRVLKKCGFVSIYVPCEPGIMLRLFRKISTEVAAKKAGYVGYSLCNARDHIHSAHNLDLFITNAFTSDTVTRIRKPFPIRSWYLNLFTLYEIRIGLFEYPAKKLDHIK
jgi:phosphatidylethanolamine/phosphatidyl-N-methylethanolamine N-methyltransferase